MDAPPRIFLDLASAITLYDEGILVQDLIILVPRDENWEQAIGAYVPGSYVQVGVEGQEREFTAVVSEIDITRSTVTVVV
jgi:hypothetical protein